MRCFVFDRLPVRPTCAAVALFAAVAASPTLNAQTLLHYKFDESCGGKVVNYAPGSPAPNEGTIVTTLPGGVAAAWAPGRFGGALSGNVITANQYSYVDTGWNPGTVTGSVSYAFWCKANAGQPPQGTVYVFGAPISFGFRLFTGSSAKLFTASWQGTSSATLTSQASVWALAQNKWVHVALVIDATTNTATYWIDGVPESPISINPGGANWTAPSFYVGRQINATAYNPFDLDEFMLVNRALTSAEIAVLAAAPLAADGPYGSGGCGGLTLGSSGGAPRLGNGAYALQLNGANPALYTLGFGSNRCTIGAVALPFDLGTVLPGRNGCEVASSFDLVNLAGFKPAGPHAVPLPIPSWPNLQGLTLYLQVAAQDVAANRVVLSNAFAVGIGN